MPGIFVCRSGGAVKPSIPFFFVTEASRADKFVKKQALKIPNSSDGASSNRQVESHSAGISALAESCGVATVSSDSSALKRELLSEAHSMIDQFVLVTTSFRVAPEHDSNSLHSSITSTSDRRQPL